jgi:hypothetical protein
MISLMWLFGWGSEKKIGGNRRQLTDDGGQASSCLVVGVISYGPA